MLVGLVRKDNIRYVLKQWDPLIYTVPKQWAPGHLHSFIQIPEPMSAHDWKAQEKLSNCINGALLRAYMSQYSSINSSPRNI